jgi:hypothetical protein
MKGDHMANGRKLTLGEIRSLDGMFGESDPEDFLVVKKMNVKGRGGKIEMVLKRKSDGCVLVVRF